MRDFASLIGRILVSAIFLMAGLNKILDPIGTRQYMAAYGMPFVNLFLVAAIILEVGGGLSLLLGYKARWGAIALMLFLIPTTLIFHTKFSDRIQVIMFMKNLAILGGLLMVGYCGPGRISLDARISSRSTV